jgi:hypothetical protein
MSTSATFQPGVNGDDGFWDSRGITPSGNYLQFGRSNESPLHSWSRFPNTMPTGIIIEESYLEFTCYSAYSTANCILRIYFNAIDAAIAPTTRAQAEALALTDYIDYTPAAWVEDSTYRSPELKSILQQVIDRPGRSSNAAIMALIKDNGSASMSRRFAYARDNSVPKSTKLFVRWSEGGLAVCRRMLLGVGA